MVPVSKPTVTRLFVGAVLVMLVGLVLAIGAVLAAIAGGTFTIGGPTVVTINGSGLAGVLAWLLVASLAMAAGTLAAIAAWVGALFNTAQLDDKTWFIVLLVLGLVSLGWVAMAAYVLAGPDSTRTATPVGMPTAA